MRTCSEEGYLPSLMNPAANAGLTIERILSEDNQTSPGDGNEHERTGRPLADTRPPTVGGRVPSEAIADDTSGDGGTPGVMDRMVTGLLRVLFFLFIVFWVNGPAPIGVAVSLLKLNHSILSGILLTLPFAMLILTASVVAVMRSTGGAGETAESTELDDYQVAVLARGPEFATNTAIASLVHRGFVDLDASERRLSLSEDEPNDMHPLEDAIRSAIDPESGKGLDHVRFSARLTAYQIKEELVQRGLIMSEGRKGMITLTLFLTCLLGLPGCWGAGIWTGYPVAMVVPFASIIIAMGITMAERTRKGDQVLNGLKERHASEELATSRGEERGADVRLVLSLALLDRDALPDGALAEVWDVLNPDGDVDDSEESDGADDGGTEGGGD